MAASFEKPQLHNAVERGVWSEVTRARREGVPWSEITNAQGIRALHQAVLVGETPIVRYMLDWDAPPGQYQTKGGQRHSPLWAAISRHRDDVAEMLVRAGAECDLGDPFDPANRGVPPLVGSSVRRMPQTTMALLHCGADFLGLTPEQRLLIFKSWLTGLSLNTPGSLLAVQALDDTGWFPQPDEARALDDLMREAGSQLSGEALQTLERLRASWRERRSKRSVPNQTATAPVRHALHRERP